MSSNKLINIKGLTEQNDPFYRYKMEKVELNKEGSQFVFLNVDKIAVSLNREPNNLISFLKKHFATLFSYKNNVAKTTKTDLTVNLLQDAIFQYVETNVLCKKCKLPETIFKKDKKKNILHCNACGHIIQM